VSVDLSGDVKTVVRRLGHDPPCAAVILAMGSAYRELGLPNEKRLSGHGVSWCATCDGFFFRDQDIAVVGGGDSAIEEATFLTRFARSVTLVHRRDELRASKIMAERAFANEKMHFAWNSEVEDVLGDAKVSGGRAARHRDRRRAQLPVTGLFVAIGHDPRSELVHRGQVGLDDEGYVVVEGRPTRTNVPGRLRLRRPRRPHLPAGHHGGRDPAARPLSTPSASSPPASNLTPPPEDPPPQRQETCHGSNQEGHGRQLRRRRPHE
jgi:thioredoxin reductase (NADPH)